MSYSFIKQRLDQGKIIILDEGIGAELEKNGANMDQDLWCGKCSVDNPELVKKVHENYIDAGADVITTNTYGTTPISMKQYGYDNLIDEYNKKSVQNVESLFESVRIRRNSQEPSKLSQNLKSLDSIQIQDMEGKNQTFQEST